MTGYCNSFHDKKFFETTYIGWIYVCCKAGDETTKRPDGTKNLSVLIFIDLRCGISGFFFGSVPKLWKQTFPNTHGSIGIDIG